MAQGRKPKGIIDDLGKKVARLLRAGKEEEAAAVRSLMNTYINDSGKNARGTRALIGEWDRKLGADYFIERDVKNAGNRGAKRAAESRQRGFVSKTRGVGARQQANPSKAVSDAAERAGRRADWVKSGGKNAPKKASKRMTAREAASQAVRKDAKDATAARKVARKKSNAAKIKRARGQR